MSNTNKYFCITQDSSRMPHGIPISKLEYEQDDMCSICADNVWEEMYGKNPEFKWKHETKSPALSSTG